MDLEAQECSAEVVFVEVAELQMMNLRVVRKSLMGAAIVLSLLNPLDAKAENFQAGLDKDLSVAQSQIPGFTNIPGYQADLAKRLDAKLLEVLQKAAGNRKVQEALAKRETWLQLAKVSDAIKKGINDNKNKEIKKRSADADTNIRLAKQMQNSQVDQAVAQVVRDTDLSQVGKECVYNLNPNEIRQTMGQFSKNITDAMNNLVAVAESDKKLSAEERKKARAEKQAAFLASVNPQVNTEIPSMLVELYQSLQEPTILAAFLERMNPQLKKWAQDKLVASVMALTGPDGLEETKENLAVNDEATAQTAQFAAKAAGDQCIKVGDSLQKQATQLTANCEYNKGVLEENKRAVAKGMDKANVEAQASNGATYSKETFDSEQNKFVEQINSIVCENQAQAAVADFLGKCQANARAISAQTVNRGELATAISRANEQSALDAATAAASIKPVADSCKFASDKVVESKKGNRGTLMEKGKGKSSPNDLASTGAVPGQQQPGARQNRTGPQVPRTNLGTHGTGAQPI